MPEPYCYEALPQGKYFRYLILEPGTNEDPLEFSIHACLLDEAPPFEAISYAWGSTDKLFAISCSGRTIAITASLQRSLQQVRRSTQTRVLWVDSVCINQEDLQEQGHQVYFMDEIYARSKQTLICLGTEDNEGHAALAGELVAQVADLVDSGMARLKEQAAAQGQEAKRNDVDEEGPWNHFPYPHPQDPLLHDKRWAAYDEMMKHLWFTRGWVVQEAAMARKSLILWSQTQIAWREIMRVCIWLNRRSPEFFNHRLASIPWLQLIAHRHKHPEDFRAFYPNIHRDADILTILHHARLLGFLQARDRIFAFKALARFTSMEDLFADLEYSQSHTALYHRFTCKYLGKTGDIGFLDYILHDERTLQDVDDKEVPSWALRWDVHMELTFDIWGSPMRFPDSLNFRPVLEDNNRTLRVHGALLDRIEQVFYSTQDPSLSMILDLKEQVQKIRSTHPYKNGDVLPPLLDALCVGRFLGTWSDWCARRKIVIRTANDMGQRASEPTVEKATSSDKDTDRLLSLEIIFSAIRRGLWSRKFIVTQRGYYGLAPAVSRPGDWCCALSGTTALAVLRETDGRTDNGKFKALGSVWLASKNTRESHSQTFHHMLGSADGAEWEDWAQEQDFLLA